MMTHTDRPAIRLIATDLDGTFFGDSGQPTPQNCAAVLRAAELGVPTIFATGRPSRWLDALDPVRSAQPMAITSNGALAVDLVTDKVIRTFPLDIPATAAVIADVLDTIPNACFAVEYVEGWGKDDRYPPADIGAEADIIRHDPVDLLDQGTPIKLLIRNRQHTLKLLDQVAPIVGRRLNLTFSVLSEMGFLELSRPGVSKATTLASLLADRGIAPADVAAFGDMPNDIEMLDLVGHPFAMDNAHESLKTRGYSVCGHHADSAFATTVAGLLGF